MDLEGTILGTVSQTGRNRHGEQSGVPHWGEVRRRDNTGAEDKEVQITKYKISYKDSL